jgi:hypothetical protein
MIQIAYAENLEDIDSKQAISTRILPRSITFDVDKPYMETISKELKRNVELLIRVFSLIK